MPDEPLDIEDPQTMADALAYIQRQGRKIRALEEALVNASERGHGMPETSLPIQDDNSKLAVLCRTLVELREREGDDTVQARCESDRILGLIQLECGVHPQ